MRDHLATPPAHEILWLACRQKTCCHTTRVIVGGRDVWQIARTIGAPPWAFTVYAPAVDGAVDAFRLAPDGPAYQLLLAKRGKVGPRGAPCFFLWKLADGHAQCGLGDLRPGVCRSYPALLVDGLLRTDGSACTCRTWSVVDLDETHHRPLVQRVLAEAEEYARFVAGWNASLAARPAPPNFRDYCADLVAHYDNLSQVAP